MREARVFIPWLGPSMNKIWAGMHWAKRKKIADEAHEACMAAWDIDPFEVPVSLIFQPVHGKGRRRTDCTNYAVSVKGIEDGLVSSGVLQDDSFRHVVSMQILAPIQGRETGMWVTITSRPEADV